MIMKTASPDMPRIRIPRGFRRLRFPANWAGLIALRQRFMDDAIVRVSHLEKKRPQTCETCGFAWSQERALLGAHFYMKPVEKDRHDAKLQVRRDYVCLPSKYHDLESLGKALETQLTHLIHASPESPGVAVADQRPLQELLSASLHSPGSAFIFSASPPPGKRAGRKSDRNRSPVGAAAGGLCVRVVRLEEAQAQLGDDVSLATLLAKGPLPILVAPLLHKPFFGRKWDAAKQSDHWLASDGSKVVSLEISGASASAVARMRLRFDDLRIISSGLLPSLNILHDLLEEIAREDGQVMDLSAGLQQHSGGTQP